MEAEIDSKKSNAFPCRGLEAYTGIRGTAPLRGQIFQKSRSHTKILGTRWSIWSHFHAEDTQKPGAAVQSLVSWATCQPGVAQTWSRWFQPQHYMDVSGQLHVHSTLSPGKHTWTHRIEGWVGPRVGIDVSEKWKISSSCVNREVDCSTCSLVTMPTKLFWILSVHCVPSQKLTTV